MIKLKKILKESKYAFDRKFGDPLPTFKDVMETHQNIPKEKLNEGYRGATEAAEAFTRYLIGDRKIAIRNLTKIAKLEIGYVEDPDEDSVAYNQQWKALYLEIYKVIKRNM